MEPLVIGEGDPLKVLSAGAVRASLLAAATSYNRITGQAFAFVFDTAGGVEKRAAGEGADVVASSMDSLRALRAAGALDSEPAPVGAARLALGVRAGERAPDISSLGAFKSALRNARNVALGDPAGGGTAAQHLASALARIGVADDVAAKSVLRVGGINVMRAVADGLADFGMTQSTEIVPVDGVELAAWLPDEVQATTVYGVAVGANAARPDDARAFVQWLTGPEAARHFAEAGFSAA